MSVCLHVSLRTQAFGSSIYLFVCLFMTLYAYLSFSADDSSVCLTLTNRLPNSTAKLYTHVCLRICLCLCLYMSVCASVYMSVCASVCLSVCFSLRTLFVGPFMELC